MRDMTRAMTGAALLLAVALLLAGGASAAGSTIDRYSGEPIQYTGERVEGDLATVSTKITTKQRQEVPVDYRMLRRDDRWLIYDVSVEGVSLIGNYRTQFNSVLRTSSYGELVKRMRAKAEEPKAKP